MNQDEQERRRSRVLAGVIDGLLVVLVLSLISGCAPGDVSGVAFTSLRGLAMWVLEFLLFCG